MESISKSTDERGAEASLSLMTRVSWVEAPAYHMKVTCVSLVCVTPSEGDLCGLWSVVTPSVKGDLCGPGSLTPLERAGPVWSVVYTTPDVKGRPNRSFVYVTPL